MAGHEIEKRAKSTTVQQVTIRMDDGSVRTLEQSSAPAIGARVQVEGGKLRVLAVTGAQETTRLPGVPTIAAMGYPGFASDQWYGLFVPAGTAPAIVRKIEADIQTVSADSRTRAQMWQRGAEIRYQSAKPFADMVRADSHRWAANAKATDARAE